MNMTDNRHPAGTSIGGQWAPGSAAEIDEDMTTGHPDADSLRERGGLGTGGYARVGQSHFLRSTRGLAVLSRIGDSRTNLTFFAEDPRGGTEMLERTFGSDDPDLPVVAAATQDKPLVPLDDEGRGIEAFTFGKTLDEALDDEETVRSHIESWAPASLGSFRDGVSDDEAMREGYRGYHRLAPDTEDLERAEHFVRTYDEDRILSERIPRLSDDEKSQLIETLRESDEDDDDDGVEDAASRLDVNSRIYETPFDPSRPPLRHIDEEFQESQEALGMGNNPDKVFAYTVRPSSSGSRIDQIFEVKKNEVGRPVVATHTNIGD